MKDERIPTIAEAKRRFSGESKARPEVSGWASGKDEKAAQGEGIRVTRSRKA